MAERKNLYLSDGEFKWIAEQMQKEGRSFSNYIQQLVRAERKRQKVASRRKSQ